MAIYIINGYIEHMVKIRMFLIGQMAGSAYVQTVIIRHLVVIPFADVVDIDSLRFFGCVDSGLEP